MLTYIYERLLLRLCNEIIYQSRSQMEVLIQHAQTKWKSQVWTDCSVLIRKSKCHQHKILCASKYQLQLHICLYVIIGMVDMAKCITIIIFMHQFILIQT